ncbi:MAG: ATP-binding protein [Desulfobulbaceae bacterium]|nr:ATP-binding protein [Desulfobulbaceae bacterium]
MLFSPAPANNKKFHGPSTNPWLCVIIVAALYVTSLHNYLLFHSLLEMFNVIVTCTIFIITWNTRRFWQNNYFLFIGLSYLFVSALTLLHVFAYKGMHVFLMNGPNLPTQLWIAGRYLEGFSFLIAPFLLHRKIRSEHIFACYLAITILLLASIFYWHLFPDCFIEGQGLTSFKKGSEIFIGAIFLVAIVLHARHKNEFSPPVFRLLIWSQCFNLCAGLFFIFYIDVFDISNLLGHLTRLIAFYLIYKAIIAVGLQTPYNLLFLESEKERGELLQYSDKLEQIVAEKTAKLKQTNMRLATTLANVADAIITIDATGIVESFNPAAEKIFGYPAAEIIGQNVSMLMPEPYRSRHDHYLHQYDKTNISRVIGKGPMESSARRRDGSGFPIDLSVSQMELEGRRIFIGVIRDISERKKAEEKIIRQRAELAAAKRTKGLKEGFLAMVSHEMRTPLTPIIGFSERIMKKSPPDGKIFEAANHILKSAKRLQEIINDLLDFSKVEAGKLQLDIKPVNFQHIMDHLLPSINQMLQAKDLKLTLSIPPNLPLLAADRLRLEQILLNLLSNAIKFTPENGAIFVSAEDRKGQIVIMVRDNGEGISAEDQLLIFDHFHQVKRQTQEQQGTGLGLAITKNLVELHGGKIWVESEPGRGATFTFTLFAAPAAATETVTA